MLATSMKVVMVAAVLTALGCGGKSGDGDGGNMGGLDGFLSSSCSSPSDCVADACSVAKCNAATHQCQNEAKSCTQANGCNVSASSCATVMCDASSGQAVWNAVAQNEGMSCTTDQGAAGACTSGSCEPIPSCYDPTFSFSMAACGPDNSSEQVGDNDPNDFFGGAATVSTYTCVSGETGPELAFPLTLDSTLTSPTNVTVSLRLVDPNTYATLADQTTVDLDLIVLQDTCTSTATCANPSAGSAVQGVTAGTSAERVTFMADPTKTYYLVVDSKSMTDVSTFVLSVESCGQCAVTPQTDLDCNTSMPLTGLSTMGGSTVLTNYTCSTGSTTTFAMAGDEIPFLLRDGAGVARNITASLSGATTGAGLLVLNEATNGDCQGTDCIAGATADGSGNASVTWTTDPVDSFSGSPAMQRFWVVVDTPTTADSSFGLSVACAPYCAVDPNNSLYCEGNFTFNTEVDMLTTAGGPAQASAWGPGGSPCGGLTGLAGPEHIIAFTPDGTGTNSYTFTLQSNDATKDLSLVILDGGTAGTCNPTGTCASFAAASGSGASGTLTTKVAMDQTAQVTLSAIHGHTYYLVVDGVDASGAEFNLLVDSAGTGCH